MDAIASDFGVSAGCALDPGAEIAGRYRIERLLAWGGMAAIYVCDDSVLGRKVALKVLRTDAGSLPELVERLLNEARALAKLKSVHVMRVLDCGRLQLGGAEDLPFIALELLEGSDLWGVLSREGRLPLGRAVRYALEACEGLAEAHALHIVHRDLKPENIFLARTPDGEEIVKLIDFGISKQLVKREARPLTLPSDCLGSPQYMAPEQMRGLEVDARTDIWALGAVLFECVLGRPPFPGSTVFEISAHVLKAPLPNLRLLAPELPEAFVSVIERCLQRDPRARFQNVAELAQALEPFAPRERVSTSRRIAKVLALEASHELGGGVFQGAPLAPVTGESDDAVEPIEASEAIEASDFDEQLEPLRIAGLRSYRGYWVSLLLAAGIALLGYRYPQRVHDMANRARVQLDAWVAGAGLR